MCRAMIVCLLYSPVKPDIYNLLHQAWGGGNVLGDANEERSIREGRENPFESLEGLVSAPRRRAVGIQLERVVRIGRRRASCREGGRKMVESVLRFGVWCNSRGKDFRRFETKLGS